MSGCALSSHFTLEVAGSPSPRLEWTSSRVRSLYTRLTSGEDRAELSLGLVTREMAGSYTCTAHNGDGQAPVQRTVIVQVQCKCPLRGKIICRLEGRFTLWRISIHQ